MVIFALICYLVAVICFLLATFGDSPRVNLIALGLLAWVLVPTVRLIVGLS